MEMKDIIMISKKEHDDFRRQSLLLSCLENAGVDNWEWYHEAYSDYLTQARKLGLESLDD